MAASSIFTLMGVHKGLLLFIKYLIRLHNITTHLLQAIIRCFYSFTSTFIHYCLLDDLAAIITCVIVTGVFKMIAWIDR